MDILPGLVFVLVGFAIVGWVVSPGTARGLDQFAAGFLPYRGPGWPQGVQEEDPLPWSWSPPGTNADPHAEVVDIGRGEGLAATALARTRMAR